MMPIDVRGLQEVSARLFDRAARLVGWGTGSVFDYFHGLYPVRLEYLIDNDASQRGRRRNGFGVTGPERLASEDPSSTVVIIYSSAWEEIARQIATMGPFKTIPASAAFADASVRASLAYAEALAARPLAARRPRPYNTVVVQGPVLAGVTAHVVRTMAALHPSDLLLLSTWDDTPSALLDEVRSVADDIVLSARPGVAGVQNRNCQIVSTKAGVDRARELGARTILKLRSDIVALAPSLFGQARWWLNRIDGRVPRGSGLRDRLIVPAAYTRKFLLYHPSDLIMLGAADDMARYWSARLDERSGPLLDLSRVDRPLAAVNMDGFPTESYLGLEFCRSIGRSVQATLRDSWDFYRDLFAVVDNSWFELLWFKNLSIPDAAVRTGVRQMVSQSFWRRLHCGDGSVDRELSDVDVHAVALRALSGAA